MRFKVQNEICSQLAWAMEGCLAAAQCRVVLSFTTSLQVSDLRDGEVLASASGVCGISLEGENDGRGSWK
jgi:hypothetical protein